MRIVYLDIDSLRPDHMGCYGYNRNTTPCLDQIAAEGVRFDQVYTAASPCAPSRASFMSGRFGINHGVLTHWGAGCHYEYPQGDGHSKEYPFLPRLLREADYRTITFSSFGDRHHAWWYFAGWNEIHTHTLKGGNEDAHEVNAAVLPWVKAHGAEDNYFLHIQYWDAHSRYTYPEQYAEQFANEPAPVFPTEEDIKRHRQDTHPRSATFLHWSDDYSKIPKRTMPLEIAGRQDYEKLINGYDGGISYLDEHIGQLMDAFRELGVLDDVCFIVSADHAESFGEQGVYLEHGMATEAVHHIPLIMKFPGLSKTGHVDKGLHYNVDVVATIADLAGLPKPAGWDGRSLLPALTGGQAEKREFLVLEHGLYACQRAVRTKEWHYIRTYHEGFYQLEPDILYDLERDPYQRNNVASEHPDVVRQLGAQLEGWIAEQMAGNLMKDDPMMEIIEDGGPFRYLKPHDWAGRLERAGRKEEAAAVLGR